MVFVASLFPISPNFLLRSINSGRGDRRGGGEESPAVPSSGGGERRQRYTSKVSVDRIRLQKSTPERREEIISRTRLGVESRRKFRRMLRGCHQHRQEGSSGKNQFLSVVRS
jgi:hypothetical protein